MTFRPAEEEERRLEKKKYDAETGKQTPASKATARL
jgi:hypothetical protein